MASMPRVNVSLTAPQHGFLEQESARLGISFAEMIRRIVDQYRERVAFSDLVWAEQQREWRELAERTAREQDRTEQT